MVFATITTISLLCLKSTLVYSCDNNCFCYNFSLNFFVLIAIKITGHDSPIIVGTSGTINCSTVLNASKMEWLLAGIGNGDPIEETTQGQTLVLSLSPKATGLDGARLTCKVTTTDGKIFKETITVQIKGQNFWNCDSEWGIFLLF